MFDFQKLDVYQKAKSFHIECKRILLENKLDSYAKDQLGRASFSVPLNIAEGSGKFSKRDRKNFFVIARASIFECVAILDILSEQGLVSNNDKNSVFNMANELSRMLFAMINNLK